MYGIELRKKIVEAHEKGLTAKQICEVFGVSERMVYYTCSLYRETNSVEPRPKTGRKPRLNEQDLRNIESAIEEQSDITLRELIEKLDLNVCESALCRIVRNKLGYTYKKTDSRNGAGERRRTGKSQEMGGTH